MSCTQRQFTRKLSETCTRPPTSAVSLLVYESIRDYQTSLRRLFADLPAEVQLLVLKRIADEDVRAARRVCRRWRHNVLPRYAVSEATATREMPCARRGQTTAIQRMKVTPGNDGRVVHVDVRFLESVSDKGGFSQRILA